MLRLTNRRSFYGHTIVAAGFTIQLMMWGAFNTFGVFLKPLSLHFGWSRALTAGAYTLNTVLFGVLGILTGRLVDRFGPRLVVTVCSVLLGAGYLVMAGIQTAWQLYFALGVLVGVGLSGSYVPLSATVARWFVARRGLMTGVVVSGAGAGGLVAPIGAALLVESFAWRMSYLIIGLVTLALSLAAAQFLVLDPATRGSAPYGAGAVDPDVPVAGFTLAESVRTASFWLLASAWLIHGLFGAALTVHLVAHATDMGIADTTAAGILGAVGGLGIAGSFLMGAVADRLGSKAMLLVGYGLTLLALLLLVVADDAWPLLIVAVAFGFGWYGIGTIVPLVTAELFGTRALGMILGVIELMWAVGAGLGPLLLGYVFDVTGTYRPGFVGSAVLSLAALVACLILPLPGGRRAPGAS